MQLESIPSTSMVGVGVDSEKPGTEHPYGAFPLHGTARFGTAHYGTA